ncbi:putative membrane protein, partial [Vibrio parahaemolyticus 10296]
MRLRTWGVRTWFNAHDEPLDNIDSAKLFLLEFFLVLL